MKINISEKIAMLKNLPEGTFLPYSYLFEEEVKIKTKKMLLAQDTFGLSKGEYFFVENYCIDKKCDCRKAMINIRSRERGAIIGAVGFWLGR